MIAELNESNRPQFLAAVRGRPYFGDILPVHLAVFGRSGALMRFYVADGSAAVQLKGRSAVLCGTYDAEETGARASRLTMDVDRDTLRAYRETVRQFLAETRRFCASRAVPYMLMRSDERAEEALRTKGCMEELIR